MSRPLSSTEQLFYKIDRLVPQTMAMVVTLKNVIPLTLFSGNPKSLANRLG